MEAIFLWAVISFGWLAVLAILIFVRVMDREERKRREMDY